MLNYSWFVDSAIEVVLLLGVILCSNLNFLCYLPKIAIVRNTILPNCLISVTRYERNCRSDVPRLNALLGQRAWQRQIWFL